MILWNTWRWLVISMQLKISWGTLVRNAGTCFNAIYQSTLPHFGSCYFTLKCFLLTLHARAYNEQLTEQIASGPVFKSHDLFLAAGSRHSIYLSCFPDLFLSLYVLYSLLHVDHGEWPSCSVTFLFCFNRIFNFQGLDLLLFVNLTVLKAYRMPYILGYDKICVWRLH